VRCFFKQFPDYLTIVNSGEKNAALLRSPLEDTAISLPPARA
jgi:hypothetical protein